MPSEVTSLSPLEEALFRKWATSNKVTDIDNPDAHYDYRGFFKSGTAHSQGNHFPDTWKQHGHPTFSDESQYATPLDPQGGMWINRGGGDELIKRIPVLNSLEAILSKR